MKNSGGADDAAFGAAGEVPVLCLLRPGGLGLGRTNWQAPLTGTFAGFALAAVYGDVLLAAHRATQFALRPFLIRTSVAW